MRRLGLVSPRPLPRKVTTPSLSAACTPPPPPPPDLSGRIPSADEARRFFAEPAADKRARLIDRLLAGDDYPRRMQIAFDAMLMERRADKHIPSPQWQAFLVESFRQNKPYHQLVREILSSDGSEASSRGAAKFYLDREADANLLTRDIGRIFLGMDLQCAQCHDHPLIDDYVQIDYYGIYAFVSRSYVFTAKKDKTVTLAEKGEGEVTFTSVFTEESARRRRDCPRAKPSRSRRLRRARSISSNPRTTCDRCPNTAVGHVCLSCWPVVTTCDSAATSSTDCGA